MRILAVEPGPNFSVMDVHRGWVKALTDLGHQVRSFPTGDALAYWQRALQPECSTTELPHASARRAAHDLLGKTYEWWPDLILVTSSFFVPPEIVDLWRSRRHKVVCLLTESPYEDPSQYDIAARYDAAFINDPTNLDTFRQYQPSTWYLPHAYDPERHRPGPAAPDLKCDFGWVGTAYPGRRAFFESVNWDGLDVLLGGNWTDLDPRSPLNEFLLNDRENCFENSDTVDLYRSCRASANIYRAEHTDAQQQGWAMGPREVELAATGCFYLAEPRGENREVLPFVPTFDGPADFAEQLRWWLDRDDGRQRIADKARETIADRTFTANAAKALSLLDL